jgi:hypothetical protein
MRGLFAKFVNAVGGSDTEERHEADKINVMKIYVPWDIIMFVV